MANAPSIGDYTVLRRIGGGGMANLYLADKTSKFGFIHRAVLKQVKRGRPDSKQLQRMLLDEARANSYFDHPNLVSLLDIGSSDHGLFIALEYVDGTDLRRVNTRLRARREALPFELACFLVGEVLRGVHHAHSACGPDGQPLEIVHRDINPSNVLVSRSGHVKLTDFGVVRMRERVQPKTEPGLVKGKYAYLAPEYIAGEACSTQTDIYAAGIMLFELLSGRECFTGATAYEVMWKIVNKGVPMYRLQREGVPEGLQRIVARATEMVPERRYASAQDMANALEAWLMRSGRHATSWVLSVFFERHDLFPDDRADATQDLSNDLPSHMAKPSLHADRAGPHTDGHPAIRPDESGVDLSLTPALKPAAAGSLTPTPIVDLSLGAPVSPALSATQPEPLFSNPTPAETEAEASEANTNAPAPTSAGIIPAARARPESAPTQDMQDTPVAAPPTGATWREDPPQQSGWSTRPPSTVPPGPPTRDVHPKGERALPETQDVRTGNGAQSKGVALPSFAAPTPSRPVDVPSLFPPRAASPAPLLDLADMKRVPSPDPAPSAPPGLDLSSAVLSSAAPTDSPPLLSDDPELPVGSGSVPRLNYAAYQQEADPSVIPEARAQEGPISGLETPANLPSTSPRSPQPAPTPANAGKLEDTPAVDVISRLVDDKANGEVEFRCGLIWKRVRLRDGVPVGVTSNMGMELIGEHLVKSRILHREALDQALMAAERTKTTLSDELLRRKLVDEPTLARELGVNITARLKEVLQWRWGTYEFQEKELVDMKVLPELDLEELLQRPDPPSGAAAPAPPQGTDLESALQIAKDITANTGRGRVDRPWRPGQ